MFLRKLAMMIVVSGIFSGGVFADSMIKSDGILMKQADAKRCCPKVCMDHGAGKWTGQWKNTPCHCPGVPEASWCGCTGDAPRSCNTGCGTGYTSSCNTGCGTSSCYKSTCSSGLCGTSYASTSGCFGGTCG